MTRIIAILTLVAAVGFALSPVFSAGFPGFSPDQFPIPQEDPPIQPVGWAFSIWLPIYAWLIASALFGFLKRAEDEDWQQVRWPLLVSLAIGVTWIPVANVSPLWATLLIWLMWAGAVVALLRAPERDHWWLRAPVGLYAGWLTAASCVATAILLTGHGLQPVQPIHGAFVLFAVSLAITILRAKPAIPMFALAMFWALIGILVTSLTAERWIFTGVTVVAMLLVLPAAGRNVWAMRHRKGAAA